VIKGLGALAASMCLISALLAHSAAHLEGIASHFDGTLIQTKTDPWAKT
jgi:hypothetical protein